MEYQTFLESKVLADTPTGREPHTIPDMLFPFQRDIVRWAVRRGRAAIFADCGLGKTLMHLAWAMNVPGDVLILAPLAVAAQTVREGEKIGLGVTLCRSQEDVRRGVNITNYERLEKFDPLVFAGIVLDESSILKSYTGKTRTMIIESFRRTPYRLACTATPAPNDHMELGNHAEFLGVMSRTEMLATFFCHDGGDTSQWRLKGHAEGPFWAWMASWAVVLRKPSDLGYSDDGFTLPPLIVTPILVESPPTDSGTLFPMPATDLQDRREARRSSLPRRVEEAVRLAGSQGPCLIWCDLNDESAQIAAKIDGAIEVTGSQPIETKEQRLAAFTTTEHAVMVSKPSIAGFGLNWQHCARVVFCGLSDSYEAYYQAIRRCWRFGQTKPVQVYLILSEREVSVLDNIQRKEAEANKMADAMVAHTAAIAQKNLHGTVRYTADYVQDECAAPDGRWRMLLGDSVEVSKRLPDASIDGMIFSPPFSSLYTYSASDRDMGNCLDDEAFFAHFGFLIPELYRVTKPGRLCAIHCMNLPTTKTRDGYIGIKDFRGDIIRAFIGAGWIYHSEVLIWKDPVTAMQRTKALGLLHKQLKKDSTLSRQGIADYVVVMRKPGENSDRVTHTAESFPVSRWQEWASPVWMDIKASRTLQRQSAREDEDERHIAPLQLEVIERCLTLWTNPGELILSPFAGIGSEGYQALLMGRRFIGIELKRSYYDQAIENLRAAAQQSTGLFADAPLLNGAPT
jgi:DNA modification methylase